MIKLKPRLLEIANLLLPPNAESLPLAVCDVGTDHGYIPIYLVQNGVKSAIASDVSKDSADKALQNVMKFELEDRIDVRVGDGLKILSDHEADTVIIAGMGGILMTEILAQDVPDGVKKIVLQPMRAAYELRKWLANNGYRITDERLVLEGKKLYNIILVEPGTEKNATEFDLFIGAKLVQKRHPLLIEHAKVEYNRINKRIQGLIGSKQDVEENLLLFEKEIRRMIDEGGTIL